ncbi:BAH-PHD domain-containing protein [Thecamonas trahens ATCC 50062]|uniref:BAH-PHD domain-containing protein n=1 Tax=Thecamonas trahens ATCC 50062 TaxID=461836 RepID=A0A0L0DD17_THETB|nr:BAH-PHD domain-containing protein [Thecamonas trahens ATCC 50062]KNC50237.1 BAH-PHD domain-containing protein [Thecamonas trahens ATCC 50062]|eukprot:XP_013757067.1 BAH-PHD domain-containing protein [Thecamonas trahens ATCC 50062]
MTASYGSFELQGVRFFVGDVLVARASDDGSTLPYLGKLVAIELDETGSVALDMRWYYRPEETQEGRQFHHGKKEVFSSNHYDRVYVESIECKALVLGLDHYHELHQRLAAHSRELVQEGVSADHVYFCRQHYRTDTNTFAPALDVYCSCKRPCNPDKLMIACDACDDWIHGECAGLDDKGIAALDNYVCDACKSKKANAS